jgi:hypothetical protein
LLDHLKDESDIDYDELQNLSDQCNQSNYANYTANLSQQSNNPQQQKRRIKAPESLKSPLAEWSEPVENWRSLITDDIMIGKAESARTSSHDAQPRRHTMNLTDLDTLTNSLQNIFAGFTSELTNMGNNIKNVESSNCSSNSSLEKLQSKVSDDASFSKKPIYFKSGPGHYDFGFVCMQEFIQVRLIELKICLDFFAFDVIFCFI